MHFIIIMKSIENQNDEETMKKELNLLQTEYFNLLKFQNENNYSQESIIYKNKLISKIESLEKNIKLTKIKENEIVDETSIKNSITNSTINIIDESEDNIFNSMFKCLQINDNKKLNDQMLEKLKNLTIFNCLEDFDINDDINSPNNIKEKLNYIKNNKLTIKRMYKEFNDDEKEKITLNKQKLANMNSINHYNKFTNKFISFKINRRNIISYSLKCRAYKCSSTGKLDLLTGIVLYNNICNNNHLSTLKEKANFIYKYSLYTILSDEEFIDTNIQKYIAEEIFLKFKEIFNSDELRNKYLELTKHKTILTNKQISSVKFKVRGPKIKLNFEEILNMTTKIDSELKLQLFRKDYITDDNEKLNFYLLLNEEMLKILKNDDEMVSQYFCDSTFRIIPNKFKEFKLLVILGFDIISKITKIGAMIFYLRMDEFTFKKIFEELKHTFNFKPKIINVDFQKSQIKALNAIYKNDIYINTCFFHFEQALVRKAKKLLIFDNDNKNILKELLLNFTISAFQEPEYAIKRYELIKKI